jgi:hypothetical protein
MSYIDTVAGTPPGGNPVDRVAADKMQRELLNLCNSWYNRCRQARLTYERQWYLNLSFYFGKHYVQWAPSANVGGALTDTPFSKLYEPAAPPWRVRLITNKVRSMIRGEISKVLKEKPRGFVIPASTDDEDRAAAKAGDAIFENLWRELLMNTVLRRAIFWTSICGSGFIKDWYDPKDVDSNNIKGAIKAEHVTAFHLLVPDLQEETLENQAYVIHVLAKNVDWVKRNFNVTVQPDSYSGGGLLEQRLLIAAGVNTTQQPRDYVAIKEAWVKPCTRWPNGAVVTWCNQQLLNVTQQWPYQYKDFPFTKFDHIPTGRFYGESTLVDLIPLQREFNRTRSQLIEAKNRMSKPQLIAPRGSVNPQKITSEPGLVIEYTPGFTPPSPLPLQNIPGYVVEEYNRIQRDMDDISSQHEITRGSVPPGVTAATAISYLQEQDDSKLAPTVSSLEEGVEKLGRHFLSHVHQFWNAQRKIRVVGQNGQFESYMFSKANVRGNTDFRVEAGSATPTSRAAKQAFIMELVKMGLIPPDKALRYLNMAETGKLYEEMQVDFRDAQRENLRIMEGEKVGVNDWDDDKAHLVEHDNFCKTQEFQSASDKLKEVMLMHRKSHQQQIAAGMGIQLSPTDPKLRTIVQQSEQLATVPQGGLPAGGNGAIPQ